jgi:hypothetical protein
VQFSVHLTAEFSVHLTARSRLAEAPLPLEGRISQHRLLSSLFSAINFVWECQRESIESKTDGLMEFDKSVCAAFWDSIGSKKNF